MRERALAAVEAAIRSDLTEFCTIERNWSGQPSDRELPAAVIFDGDEEVRDNRNCALQIGLGVEVDIICRASRLHDLGPEISERLAQVKLALMHDWTLGGAVAEVRYLAASEPLIDEKHGGSPRAALTASFELLIEHAERNPYLERNG